MQFKCYVSVESPIYHILYAVVSNPIMQISQASLVFKIWKSHASGISQCPIHQQMRPITWFSR
jgi:hypothetical protein